MDELKLDCIDLLEERVESVGVILDRIHVNCSHLGREVLVEFFQVFARLFLLYLEQVYVELRLCQLLLEVVQVTAHRFDFVVIFGHLIF